MYWTGFGQKTETQIFSEIIKNLGISQRFLEIFEYSQKYPEIFENPQEFTESIRSSFRKFYQKFSKIYQNLSDILKISEILNISQTFL